MAMRPGMKMLMMEHVRKSPENNYRSEYGGNTDRRMIGYDRDYNTENRRRYAAGEGWEGNRMEYGVDEPESRRRRDSRGRYMEGEGWESNRSYPESRYEPESRRRRDSRGRYMMDGNRMDADYEDEEDDDKRARSQTWYPPYGAMPYVPPMNNIPPMNMHHPGNSYGDIYAHGSIYAPGAMNKPMGGMMGGDMSAPVDEHTARMWVQKMDGGEKFKIEQTEQQRMAVCPDCDRWEFYVAMNAMCNDYCETAKKMNIDRPDYYAHLAKDFLKDKDAKPHKLRRYMEHIAA